MRTLFIFILAGIAFISCAQTGTISDGEGGLSARTKINATITKANNHADSIVAHVAKIDENTSDITALELISDSSYAKADVGRLEIDTIADISDDSIIIDVGYLNLIRDLYLTSEADSGIELRNYVTGERSSQVFVYDGYAGMVSNVGDDYVGAAGHSGVWVDTSDVEIYVMNSDGINTSGIYIDRLEMLVTDDINEKGLVYDDNYSDNFTDQSLVDKEYVDDLIAALSYRIGVLEALHESDDSITIDSAVVQNATPERFSVYFSDSIDGQSPDISEWTITVDGTPYEADDYQIWYDQVNFYTGSIEADFEDVVTITYSGDSWVSWSELTRVGNYVDYSVTNNVEDEEPPAPFDGTILYQWDFEDEELGLYDDEAVEADFNIYTAHWYDDDSIVLTTINGLSTQAWQIMQEEEEKQQGLQLTTYWDDLESEESKVCISYNIYFEPDFEFVSDNTKIPGIAMIGGTRWDECPTSESNVVSAKNLVKEGGRDDTYFYTWIVKDGSCPWSDLGPEGADYYLDSTWFIPGVWYDNTICVTINTEDGGVGQEDGIMEQWINGDMIFQHDDIAWDDAPDDIGFNGMQLAMFASEPETSKKSYSKIDNVTIWTPDNDTYWDGGTVHPTDYQMVSPVAIDSIYRTVYYDSTIFDLTVQAVDTLYSDNYPSAMTPGHNVSYLVYAGEGHTVKATILDGDLGGSSSLFFYNGNNTESIMNAREIGYDGDLTNNFEGNAGVVTSTGPYLFICGKNTESAFTLTFRIKVEITP